MSDLKRVNKILKENFGSRVQAELTDDVLTLHGELDEWSEVVEAGLLCANRKKYTVVNDIVCKTAQKSKMILPEVHDSSLEGREFDVVIVGAGIIGCSAARELMRYNLKVAVLDKCHDVAMQASSRNDGMIHPGIDLKPGSMKQKFNHLGNAMYPEVCRELGVDFRYTGQIICFDKKYWKFLLPLFTPYWNRILKVPCKYLNRREVMKREPELNGAITCGLLYPTAGVVCPYGLSIAYAENAADNGAEFFFDTAVIGMETENGSIKSLNTNRGRIKTRAVINAAGVFSDDIAEMAGDRFFTIHPRRGSNTILDKKASRQVNAIASIFGTADTKKGHTKGGGIVHTVDDNLLIGPNAVETPDCEDYSTHREEIEAVFKKQSGVLPELNLKDGIRYFTGVRAPNYEEDFIIRKGKWVKNIVHAAGIQSPGLTAAPAIAVELAKLCLEVLGGAEENKSFNPVRKPIPRAAMLSDEEREKLIEENPDYGVIVCRCEEISRGEIIEALHRSIPCDTVDGVKRRVRAGMGRCQGGFCGPQVTQIISEEMGIALNQVRKSGIGSELLAGPTKEE